MVFTSPPFPLNRKKKYGNLEGEEYVEWLAGYAPRLTEYLTPDGSIVIEVGNGWDAGQPTVSTLAIEALLAFKKKAGLHLCQEFICFNPARLPSPAQWVTIERCRVKDAFTRLWWMSPTPRPKADNGRVLTEYSDAMRKLLERGTYNSGRRPSQHESYDIRTLYIRQDEEMRAPHLYGVVGSGRLSVGLTARGGMRRWPKLSVMTVAKPITK